MFAYKPDKVRKPRTDAQIKATVKHIKYARVASGIKAIKYNVSNTVLKNAGIELDKLIDVLEQVKIGYLNSFHSFYVCTACSKKLTNREVRKDAKIQTFIPCTFCGTVHDPFEKGPQPKVILKKRSKLTRGEAVAKLETEYPEVFL